MTKAQQKEQAISDLAATYFRNTGCQSEQEAREYAEFVWGQGFLGPTGSHQRALGAVLRAEVHYADM